MTDYFYKQRWESIQKLEKEFLENPNIDSGKILSCLWNNWVSEGFSISNSSGEIGGQRLMLYDDYIAGRKLEGDVVGFMKINLMDDYSK